MRLCWRTQKTSQTFRQKRPTWRMHSAQVRFRWHCIGRRLMRCSHPLKESRSLTPKDDGCPGGIAPVVVRREVPGKSDVRGKDKTSCQSKNPQPRKTAKPQRLPTAKIDFAPSVGVSHQCLPICERGHSSPSEVFNGCGRIQGLGTSAVPAPYVLQKYCGAFRRQGPQTRRHGLTLGAVQAAAPRSRRRTDRLKDSWPLICAASGVLRCRSQERTTGHPKGKGGRFPSGSHPPAHGHISLSGFSAHRQKSHNVPILTAVAR